VRGPPRSGRPYLLGVRRAKARSRSFRFRRSPALLRAAVEDETVGKKLGAVFDHVLVDEFQDVNKLQLDILMGLRRCDSRLTMVGDDAQAIYGFRGASPRFLLDAQDYFAGLVTITLNVNYRSSGAILKVANALGADAPEGFCATLREDKPYSVRALRAGALRR